MPGRRVLISLLPAIPVYNNLFHEYRRYFESEILFSETQTQVAEFQICLWHLLKVWLSPSGYVNWIPTQILYSLSIILRVKRAFTILTNHRAYIQNHGFILRFITKYLLSSTLIKTPTFSDSVPLLYKAVWNVNSVSPNEPATSEVKLSSPTVWRHF